MLSVSFAPIHILLKITWGVLIVFATMFYVLRDALRQPPSAWQHIEVDTKGELVLTNTFGKRFNATVTPSTYVSTYLTIVLIDQLCEIEEDTEKHETQQPTKLIAWANVKISMTKSLSQKAPIILLPKTANADEIRKLRVWLIWWVHQAKN